MSRVEETLERLVSKSIKININNNNNTTNNNNNNSKCINMLIMNSNIYPSQSEELPACLAARFGVCFVCLGCLGDPFFPGK